MKPIKPALEAGPAEQAQYRRRLIKSRHRLIKSRQREALRRINKAMKHAYEWPVGGTSAVYDVLADLRHLCDAKAWDFADLDRQAFDHYCAEVQGED